MTEAFTDPLLAELAHEDPSGFQRAMGYRLAEWRDGEAVLTMPIGAQHLNRAGIVHGGVLVSLIDTACGFAGSFAAVPGTQSRVSTLSLTTSFVAPGTLGLLRTVGRKRGGGRLVYFAVAEVFDADGRLIAFGEGSFRYHHNAPIAQRRVPAGPTAPA